MKKKGILCVAGIVTTLIPVWVLKEMPKTCLVELRRAACLPRKGWVDSHYRVRVPKYAVVTEGIDKIKPGSYLLDNRQEV